MKLAYIFFFLFIVVAHSLSPRQWSEDRIIYQLLTDRFASGSNNACGNLGDYCGGNYRAAIDHLDYITGMGFNAIWISPIVHNSQGGYHGYWFDDLYKLNDHFGSSDDLKAFVNACHSKGIAVMVDVVNNHVGPSGGNPSQNNPFNQGSHYHGDCQINDWNNQNQVENCRLANLPDLAQENGFVKDTLYKWIGDIIQEYGFDGVRLDTVPEVPKWFWADYRSHAGVYTLGEVFNGNVGYVSQYQSVLDGVFSYPMKFTLDSVFGKQQSMNQIQNQMKAYSSFSDLTLLGSFLDNHDNARFLASQGDHQLLKSALTYMLTSVGIPVYYYGTEQGFNGGSDPYCREDLWRSGYNTNTDLYKFTKTVVEFRKSQKFSQQEQIQRYSDDNFYAFSRGKVFVALTNVGSNGGKEHRTITYHPYNNGQKICNLFYPNSDTITVQNNKFDVYLSGGEQKIYYPC
ncbi:alpha-amylase 1-related [Anaeramoeba flamelloides]|uniref:alpha-amylase n=1 Tax=Anaeramoeba flamelloides TaxID=1746091 RepID=A0AAV7Z7H7_9EUKA|nr:alpha-amylase 1-related [Anaeramoeba flamelloides]KAJ6244582.1 alpha-amylase 1-related [Anaeramoeba flamelloides]